MEDTTTVIEKNRFDRLAKVFSQSPVDVANSAELRESVQSLEKLKISELKVWWDFNTLKSYLERDMIPRGLRIKKYPTTTYSDEFKKAWNSILSRCSLDLIKLIVKHEEQKLTEVRASIIEVEKTANEKFSTQPDFTDLISKMNDNISKLEEIITNIKKKKYQRDLQDYTEDKVYIWRQERRRPRSILRKKKNFKKQNQNNQKVTFSSSEYDSSGSFSDASSADTAAQAVNQHNKTAALSVAALPSSISSTSSPFLGVGNSRNHGEANPNPRYPKRDTTKRPT